MKKITWFKYLWDCNTLLKKIVKSQENFDCILGVSKGGNIVATILAYKLNLPLSIISVESYDGEKKGKVEINRGITNFDKFKTFKKILLVDDLIDSGDTLINLTKYFKDRQISSAVLYSKNEKVTPNYCIGVFNSKTWIKFPYEEK